MIHLAECKECREEIAFLIRLKKYQDENLNEVPQTIKKSAFSLIPKTQMQHRTLLYPYLEPVFDTLKLVNLTVRFAKQII